MGKVWMDFNKWADQNDPWVGKSKEEVKKPMSQEREIEALKKFNYVKDE